MLSEDHSQEELINELNRLRQRNAQLESIINEHAWLDPANDLSANEARTWAAVERARAEEAQRQSEAKYCTLFETIDEGFCIMELIRDENGKITDMIFREANQSFERHTGLKDVNGKRVFELLPNCEDYWIELFTRVSETGKSERNEDYVGDVDRWYRTHHSRIGGPGSPFVTVTFEDITERKKAEEALKQSEEKYRTLFDTMLEGYVVLDVLRDENGWATDVRIIEMNPASERVSSMKREQLYGKTLFEVFPRSDAERWMAIWRRVADTGKAEVITEYVKLVDRWFETSAFAPERNRIIYCCRDITESKKAEGALRESEARHRYLIGSWAQAVWETDADGVVDADSPSWRSYTGQTLDEWLGYGWLNAIHPDDRAYAERQWREAVAVRRLVDAEFRLRSPDGGWRWTNVRATPLLDARGDVEKWAGMNIDIGDRKRAEEALRESEERQVYLLQLNDALRPLADPETIKREAMRLLGERLGVSRAQYYTADETGEYLSSSGGYTDGVPAATGRFRLIEFGKYAYDGFHAGETQVVSDARIDPRISETVLKSYQMVGFLAYIGVPFVQRGRFLGTIAVHQTGPREWTESERIMVEETAARAGMAVEQARARGEVSYPVRDDGAGVHALRGRPR